MFDCMDPRWENEPESEPECKWEVRPWAILLFAFALIMAEVLRHVFRH